MNELDTADVLKRLQDLKTPEVIRLQKEAREVLSSRYFAMRNLRRPAA